MERMINNFKVLGTWGQANYHHHHQLKDSSACSVLGKALSGIQEHTKISDNPRYHMLGSFLNASS